MPIYLSYEERQLVARYTKNSRPKYYFAVEQQEVEISPDMEKFIILATPQARSRVVSWLHDSNKKTKDQQDRETILKEVLEADLANANAEVAEATKGLESYDQFIESYFVNVIPEDSGAQGTCLQAKRHRFAEVAEVGQALSDMSRSVEEFLVVRERAEHLRAMTTVLQKQLSGESIGRDEKRQISSWATPFSAYTNGRT